MGWPGTGGVLVAAIRIQPQHLCAGTTGLLSSQRFDKRPHFFGGSGFDKAAEPSRMFRLTGGSCLDRKSPAHGHLTIGMPPINEYLLCRKCEKARMRLNPSTHYCCIGRCPPSLKPFDVNGVNAAPVWRHQHSVNCAGLNGELPRHGRGAVSGQFDSFPTQKALGSHAFLHNHRKGIAPCSMTSGMRPECCE